jgi:hypothetical protein
MLCHSHVIILISHLSFASDHEWDEVEMMLIPLIYSQLTGILTKTYTNPCELIHAYNLIYLRRFEDNFKKRDNKISVSHQSNKISILYNFMVKTSG